MRFRQTTSFCLCLWGFAVSVIADDRDDFERRVQPILRKRCYSCHSHEADESQAGLMLDSRSGWTKGGDSGPAIFPGKPDESLLIKAVRRSDKKLQMPPDEALPNDEVAALVEWVRRGAFDPRESPDSERAGGVWAEKLAQRQQRWCWQPVVRPPLPNVRVSDWPRNPIDRFLLAGMEGKGLSPTRDADRWGLARRLSVVLTGLPPEPKEVAAFVADPSPDAIEQHVDRWLASPQFGEHWARHWMDLIRYSDSHGSEHDPLIPHAWRYRDYLVRAFNGDVPYDRFVREHIAGDQLPPRMNPTLGLNESPIGTGWFRFVEFYPTPIDVKNEEIVVLDAQIDAFGKTFQGLTIACARCHDHKFDAISARDFAALYGIFASSRVTMHRVNDATTQHAFDQQLINLKQLIRRTLADLWREQLTHWPIALPAAIARVPEPDPPKPADGKPARPAPPPFAPGTRSLEAETWRWLTALKTAKAKPTDPLSSLIQLASVPTDNDAAADLIDPKIWGQLADSRRAAAAHRSANAQRFRWFADFNDRDPNSLLTKSAAWFATDNFEPTKSAGEFALSPSGPGILTAIYPLGRFSHLVSNKHGGSLRSPNFTLDMKFISVLACGTNNGRVRLIMENFPSDQLLFAQAMPFVNEPRLHWITIPIRDAWAGRRAYLDISPRDEMPYPGKLPDATKLNTDGRSGVGVRAVVFHDQPGPPSLASPVPDQWWDVEPKWPALVSRWKQLTDDAISAWLEDRCSDEQARFLDELLRSGVLMNELPVDSELASLVAKYREIEARVPIPIRVPGVADEVGFDERLFIRGNYRKPGEVVPRGYLEVLSDRRKRRPERGRLDLADAIANQKNPLTARVMVNRLWHHVFGVGLVKTVDNFGQLGEPPTHPELLDWLAAEFVDSGWSVKRLLRLMLTSRAFQLSSEATSEAKQFDPGNRLLSHAHVRRLQAESLRDSLLFLSGRLDRQQEGLGVPLPLSAAYKDFENPVAGPLDGHGRRSIYLEARRNYPQLLLTAFDQPKPVLTVGARDVTNVPAQSLALLNDPFVISQAAIFGDRVMSLPTAEDRIDLMYRLVFVRPPTTDETAQAIEFIRSQTGLLGLTPEAQLTDKTPWSELAQALVNMKEFLFVY